MEWTSEKYKNNLMEYEKKDGIKAIIIYCLIMGSAFFHGWLYTTNTSVLILNLSQVWIPLVLILLFACFFHCNKQKIDSVGINTDKLKNSIILGVIGGIFLLVIQTVLFKAQGKSISFTEPLLINWIIFFFAALEEEIIFRGYIQTRLSGLIRNQWIVGIINSVLFLSIHYPVRWVIIGKLYFDVLPVEYVISLLALHFFVMQCIKEQIVYGAQWCSILSITQ